jgi:hypothetical protein
MFDWIKKLFENEQPAVAELSEEEKKKAQDDFVSQTLIFPSAHKALETGNSSTAGDSGGDSGGDGGGGSAGD